MNVKQLTYDHEGEKGEYRKAAPLPALNPLHYWPNISKPDNYLEERTGKFVALLEGLLDRALETHDNEMARVLTLDLLKMTPVGRNKAEINIGNKLRDEIDLEHLDAETLERITKRHAIDSSKRLDLASNPHNVVGGTSALAAAGVKELGESDKRPKQRRRKQVDKRSGDERESRGVEGDGAIEE